MEDMHQIFDSYFYLLMQAMKLVGDALSHDSGEVRAAACICLKNVSRSVKVCDSNNSQN